MIHFGFSTYTVPPSRLLPQTLAHMTHSFHRDVTAKSFPKVKLTSRQSSTYVSSRHCPLTPLSTHLQPDSIKKIT